MSLLQASRRLQWQWMLFSFASCWIQRPRHQPASTVWQRAVIFSIRPLCRTASHRTIDCHFDNIELQATGWPLRGQYAVGLRTLYIALITNLTVCYCFRTPSATTADQDRRIVTGLCVSMRCVSRSKCTGYYETDCLYRFCSSKKPHCVALYLTNVIEFVCHCLANGYVGILWIKLF